MTPTSTPKIMCTLTREALSASRDRLLHGLAERAASRETTDDGVRLIFSASTETLTEITRVIDAERQCCRWLRFELTVTPDEGPIVLTLSGPNGAREFLESLFSA
jgi:hypothetical protein